MVLTRNEALNMIKGNVAKKNIVYHMMAVESIMRMAAKFFGEDENQWGLVGLLHDIDYEKTEATPERHGLIAEEILKGYLPDELIKAIKAHNFKHTGVKPETLMEKALIASDAISGLIVACALVTPSKKLADVKVEMIAKKFRDKDFAKGANRERILICEEMGIPREKFFEIALNGIRSIAQEIGL